MYDNEEEKAIKLANTLVRWALRTVLKIFAWIMLISIIISCGTWVITKCTKTETEVKIEKIR